MARTRISTRALRRSNVGAAVLERYGLTPDVYQPATGRGGDGDGACQTAYAEHRHELGRPGPAPADECAVPLRRPVPSLRHGAKAVVLLELHYRSGEHLDTQCFVAVSDSDAAVSGDLHVTWWPPITTHRASAWNSRALHRCFAINLKCCTSNVNPPSRLRGNDKTILNQSSPKADVSIHAPSFASWQDKPDRHSTDMEWSVSVLTASTNNQAATSCCFRRRATKPIRPRPAVSIA